VAEADAAGRAAVDVYRALAAQQSGRRVLPKINEGDLLYMPSTLPGISPGQAAVLLQQTDKLIKTVPEVASVFGKAGKAETATDSAPLEMIETTIQLKPQDQWRPGMTLDKIIDELDATVRLPGWRTCGCRRFVTVSICSPPGLKVPLVLKYRALRWQISMTRRSVLKPWRKRCGRGLRAGGAAGRRALY
jgi:hypothetical protein